MRATTLLNRLLDLPGISVSAVAWHGSQLVVDVRLRVVRLACPLCGYTTRVGYDTREVPSWWRGLDFGPHEVIVRALLRRLVCPEHGVRVQGVPFARHLARFTRDVEDVVAFWATKADKTTIARVLRLDWDTVGRICERVVADGLDEDRLDGLVNLGVDEISWKKHHKYLTLVTDHDAKKVVWGKAGKDAATLDAFFDEVGVDQCAGIEAVSMDMGPAYAKSVRADGHAPQATICIDPFHAVKIVTEALDVERRKAWNELRAGADPEAAKKFKGARWALLKNPTDLDEGQAATLRKLKRRGGDVWRAYTLKEAFRAIFAGDLTPAQAGELIDRWISRASRSRLASFVKAAKTIRKHRDGILAALRLGINKRPGGRAELGRPFDHQAGSRVPQRRGRPGPGHARLRTDHPPTAPRAPQHSHRITHTHSGSATNRPATRSSGLRASSCSSRRACAQRVWVPKIASVQLRGM